MYLLHTMIHTKYWLVQVTQMAESRQGAGRSIRRGESSAPAAVQRERHRVAYEIRIIHDARLRHMANAPDRQRSNVQASKLRAVQYSTPDGICLVVRVREGGAPLMPQLLACVPLAVRG